MALKTLSKTNILNGNIVQAADVSQSIDAFTGIEGYAISVSGSFTFSGATTGSGFFQDAVNALSGSSVYVAANNSTNNNYTLVFKNDSFGLDGYHQLAADGSNGPYYNPSTNILTAVNLSGSTVQAASITGSLLGNVNGTSSYATTASYALTASYASNGVNSLTVGAFQDNTTQIVPQNTSASLTFNTTDITDGISLGIVPNNSQIIVTKAGTYNFQFSIQIAVSAGAGATAYIWLRKNGNNVTYTNTGVYMQNANDRHVAAWNFILNLNPGDYLELVMWAQGGDIKAYTEIPIPGAGGNGNVGVPSIIATVTQIK